MKVNLPVIVKDPVVSEWKEVNPTETVTIETESHYLDGPISSRVAVLDFNPATGELEEGVDFRVDPATGEGAYLVDRPFLEGDPQVERQAAAVSIFGTVFKTLELFEEADALGRKVTWGFGSPQLLVVPRAGDWPNAFYERESRSLQFFFFGHNDKTIHTGHSQDIVAHETAHAVVDGMAPDLYHAITPQSLAIHEAVADLTALLCSFRSDELARRVLEDTGGKIDRSNAFSGIAGQFAEALQDQRNYLRELNNERTLHGDRHSRAAPTSPHQLSEVLSGALYKVLVKIHQELWQAFDAGKDPEPEMASTEEAGFSVEQARKYSPRRAAQIGPSLKALFVAGERLKRTLYRGLDYLPPGDVTFADLARAIIAADQASHPDSGRQRDWLADELVRRGVVDGPAELASVDKVTGDPLSSVDMDELISSDWVAYDFVNRHRELLGVPEGVTFEVRPRLPVERLYWHRDGKATVQEVLLKVGWTEEEGQRIRGLPGKRAVGRGTTLSIERPSAGQPKIRTIVRPGPLEESREDRAAFIRLLYEDGELMVGDEALGPNGRRLRNAVLGEILHGALRLRGTSRTLHLTREARA